jgi:iron complex transport system permease protein
MLMCIPGILAALLLSKPISAYALGEGYAQSMGIRIKPFRILLILLSSLLSACVTALAGPISFVGIAVPHITRSLLKSSKPVFVIPATFLCGAVFCIFCDLIARTVLAPTELAIGTVTSAFGAPIVIYMMVKRRRNMEA